MNAATASQPDLWPLLGYFALALALALVGFMLGGSYVAGERSRRRRESLPPLPFESGVVPVGDVALRFSVGFYLVAIFFVIFDIEAIFIFAWAIAYRESGWAGYAEIMIFIAVLGAALVYLWRIGALDWRTRRQKALDV